METTYVNYKNFSGHAGDIVSKAKAAYDAIVAAYKEVTNLCTPAGWKGEYYDDLVESFNKLVPDFNSMFESVQYKIPSTIRNAAATFANFDLSSAEESTASAETLSNIAASGETALTWNEDAVTNAQTKVDENFEICKVNVKSIVEVVENMASDWKGPAYEKILSVIQQYGSKISENLESLKNDFSKYMTQAKTQFEQDNAAVMNSLNIE